jgi:hypothetical protein
LRQKLFYNFDRLISSNSLLQSLMTMAFSAKPQAIAQDLTTSFLSLLLLKTSPPTSMGGYAINEARKATLESLPTD